MRLWISVYTKLSFGEMKFLLFLRTAWLWPCVLLIFSCNREIYIYDEGGLGRKEKIWLFPDQSFAHQITGRTGRVYCKGNFETDSLEYNFIHKVKISQQDLFMELVKPPRQKEEIVITPRIDNQYVLRINVKDVTGEPLVFATVGIYRNGVLIDRTDTDFDGQAYISSEDQISNIELFYIGFQSKKIYLSGPGDYTITTSMITPAAFGPVYCGSGPPTHIVCRHFKLDMVEDSLIFTDEFANIRRVYTKR